MIPKQTNDFLVFDKLVWKLPSGPFMTDAKILETFSEIVFARKILKFFSKNFRILFPSMVVVNIKKYKYRRPKRPAICGPVNNIAILNWPIRAKISRSILKTSHMKD